MEIYGKSLVDGHASGKVLHSGTPLSFWGGIDPLTGIIIDEHHPLRGSTVTGSVLALPSGRGSCTGSMLLLELLLKGTAPSALVLGRQDEILTLGVLVARSLFNVFIPVVVLSDPDFSRLSGASHAFVSNGLVSTTQHATTNPSPHSMPVPSRTLELSSDDRDMLQGHRGAAVKVAMEIILSFAALQDATELITISRAHIDSCIYTGPASLAFPEKLLSLGAKVAVPTTMNSISIDSRRWRELGMDSTQAIQAERLARTFVSMGAQPTFTCAPYSLPDRPSAGDQLGWGESNAVIFANSVLGARTQKYPDLLDVCVAITGRAPLAGCHTDQGRRPAILIQVPHLSSPTDADYAALGYLVGSTATSQIPLVLGLDHLHPTPADLKAFSAGFGTSSSAPMFHIAGITPEASLHTACTTSIPQITLDHTALHACISSLNTASDSSVGLVSLGNPHFLLEEFRSLAELCTGATATKHPTTDLIVTTSQATYAKAQTAGYVAAVEAFGGQVITDTCWCMIAEPVIAAHVRNIATNSAKYAHYAPGMCKRGVHFGSLRQCVRAACTGRFDGWRARGT